ncbi:MAG: hypothetical protein J6T65_11320 [Clostridia bacterium]|nr:hypothetical protein [Clostridia bacterium]
MAKQIYIDENGNPIEVSGTINTAELLPISGNDPTDTKSYIDTALVKAFTITFESGISAPRSFGYYSDLCGFGFISAVIVPSSNIPGGTKLATFDTGKGSKQAKFDIIGIDGNGSGKGLFLNGDELYTNVNLTSGISVVISGTYR